MRASRTRASRYLTVVGALCVLLLGACSKSGSNGSSPATSAGTGASASAGTGAPANACGLLTKAEVAQVTSQSIAFSKQANLGAISSCTFGSLSGFAVVLSVTTSPAAGLASNISGLGNVVTKYHLTPVSGVGDQAYIGSDAIVARKGNTAFLIVFTAIGGGNHEQALKAMATDVVSHL